MRSLILLTATAFLAALLALFSLFILLRGHHAPGGGFVGGLLLAGSIAIYLLSHSTEDARRLLRVPPHLIVAAGLLIGATSALVGVIAGRPLFAPVRLVDLPGTADLDTLLLFDVGVYLLVAGVVSEFLLSLIEGEPC